MLKHTFLIVSLVFFIVSCQKESLEQRDSDNRVWNPETTLVSSPNPWELKYYITPDDTLNGLRLEYKDEIGGSHLAFGKVIWENKKTREIRITAPWIDKAITIQKGNLISDEPKIVPLTEIEYMLELKK
jgi:hypothetical protein